jgi:hypothetical protein
MAYVDIATLKRSIVDQLAAIVPDCEVTGQPVPVDYAWPGQDAQRPTHMWLFNARCISEYGAMGAGRKRRDQIWTLQLVIEVQRKGRALDVSGRNVLQEVADRVVIDLAGLVDNWIAGDPKLGQTTSSDVPVDFATFNGYTLEEGVFDGGASARGTVDITVRIRPK